MVDNKSIIKLLKKSKNKKRYLKEIVKSYEEYMNYEIKDSEKLNIKESVNKWKEKEDIINNELRNNKDLNSILIEQQIIKNPLPGFWFFTQYEILLKW